MPKCRKWHFRPSRFQNFLGEHAPDPPPGGGTLGPLKCYSRLLQNLLKPSLVARKNRSLRTRSRVGQRDERQRESLVPFKHRIHNFQFDLYPIKRDLSATCARYPKIIMRSLYNIRDNCMGFTVHQWKSPTDIQYTLYQSRTSCAPTEHSKA